MFQLLRLKLIKALIDVNEKIFFERRLSKAYKNYFGGKVNNVIDVGANKGQTIDFFTNINPACKVSAFEPNHTLYNSLVRKYRNRPAVKIYNMGISAQSGQKLFQENVLDYTSTFEELNPDSKYLQKKSSILGVRPEDIIKDKYIVNTTTLAEFINEHIHEPIDVLKIDIEGHEFAALTGLFSMPVKQPIRYIQIEDHTDDMYKDKTPFKAIENLLNQNGFKVKEVIKHGFGNINEVIFYNTGLQ